MFAPGLLVSLDLLERAADLVARRVVILPAGPVLAPCERPHADGVTPRGKSGPQIIKNPLPPARHGLNGYTDWFAGDADMGGDYFGYDGPCPPWNDALMHHYVFTVYALDLAQLPVSGGFTMEQARAAMQGHILAQASLTGLYTLNPAVS